MGSYQLNFRDGSPAEFFVQLVNEGWRSSCG